MSNATKPLIERILVPVDFSAGSVAALRYASTLAKPFHATVEAFHVWEPLPYIAPSEMLWLGGQGDSFWKQYQANAEARLHSLLELVVESPAPAISTQVIAGYPSGSILEQIESGKYDLVVMGTRGLTGLKHLLLGSVAERVVQRAACPVLTIHANEADAKLLESLKPLAEDAPAKDALAKK